MDAEVFTLDPHRREITEDGAARWLAGSPRRSLVVLVLPALHLRAERMAEQSKQDAVPRDLVEILNDALRRHLERKGYNFEVTLADADFSG